MLLDLRETVRNSKPIKYTLITLICIPFALVGIGSYFSGGTAAPVASVNGQDITPDQLEGAYQQQRQQMARMFGGQLPEAFANETLLRQQALDQLVTQQVLASEVAEQKFAVGDQTLGRAIRDLPMFQVDGQFDQGTYQTELRSSGLSVPAFEQSFRDDTALNQFRLGVTDTSFLLPAEALQLNELTRQTRTVDAIRFDLAAAKEAIEVSPEEVQASFDENAENYQFPERVRIQYIELDAATLAEGIDVTEEESQTYYDANRGRYVRPEQREASHILLSLDDRNDADEVAAKTAEISALRARIVAGEDFADVAREASDDVGSAEGGGALGIISPGAMVPEFEEAVFALQSVDDLSDPIVSDFGVHLIKLDVITAETGQPFEEVKDEITATLQQDQADREFFDLREQLTEMAFDNPDSLDAAGDATGLEIQTSDWIDADTIAAAEAETVLSNPQVLQTALSEEVRVDGNNSDPVVVGDRHVMVLRVQDHEGQRPKTLDDVRDEVTDALRTERAGAELDTAVSEALAAIEDGQELDAVAGSSDLATALPGEVLTRQSTTFDPQVMQAIYALPAPAAGPVSAQAVLDNGDRLAYSLISIGAPEATADAAGVEAGIDPRRGSTEFQALLESLRDRADVDLPDS